MTAEGLVFIGDPRRVGGRMAAKRGSDRRVCAGGRVTERCSWLQCGSPRFVRSDAGTFAGRHGRGAARAGSATPSGRRVLEADAGEELTDRHVAFLAGAGGQRTAACKAAV